MDSGGGVGAMRARFESKAKAKEQDTNVSNLRNKFEKNKSHGGGLSQNRKGFFFFFF